MNNKVEMTGRNYALDFLKIIATIIIFCHHYQQVTMAQFNGINFHYGNFNFGYIVELFFILSGYFICVYEDRIRNGLNFKVFIGKRASRLLPVVAVSAFAFIFVNRFYKQEFWADWYGVPVTLWSTLRTALGITEGWGLPESFVNYPMWYISVLLLCYCVYFFIVYVAKRCNIPITYMCVFMICLGIWGFVNGANSIFLNCCTSRGYYSFFFGILLKKFIEKNGVSNFWIKLSALVVIVIPFMIVNCPDYVELGMNFVATFVLYPAIILLLHTKTAQNLFCWKGFSAISEISFDVYVWHLLFLIVMLAANVKWEMHLDYGNPITMFIGLGISWVIGVISHYGIEKPINRYIDKNFFHK